VAARNGLGALAFTFVDPEDARTWADTYYSIIKSDECVPLGHRINANIAVVTGFSLHEDAEEAFRRGADGFAFFRYAINALVANDTKPGRTTLWEEYLALRDRDLPMIASPGIGTPAQITEHIREFSTAGVDQIIFLQQGGKNRHEHICAGLELFADRVLPEFVENRERREAEKAEELEPYVRAALARKEWMPDLTEEEIPIVYASRQRDAFYQTG